MYRPPGPVHDAVMTAAEQHSRGDVGGAAVDPMHDVMGVTTVRERTTPGEHTPTVTTGECAALVAGEEPFGTPQIQRDTEGVEDHRPDIEVTHQRAQCLAAVRDVEPVVHDVGDLPVEHQCRFRTRSTPPDTTPRTHPTTRRSGGSGGGLGIGVDIVLCLTVDIVACLGLGVWFGEWFVVEPAGRPGDCGAAAQFLQRQRPQRGPVRDGDLTT